MPSPRLRLALLVAALVLGGALGGSARAATTCSADCTQSACTVDCSEADVRTAVALANGCAGDPGWTGRTITVATPGCTISMLNDPASAAAHPGSDCPGDPEANAVCIVNDDVTFEGEGAVFVYDGPAECGQCETCSFTPALFTLKGNRNTIANLTFRYFPEGIHLRAGAGHTLRAITADRICEDAITIDSEAGTGHVIRDSTLRGSQPPDPGRACFLGNGASGACGTDKAIQLNGGGSTIMDNVIDTMSQPLSAGQGTHVVSGNQSLGSAADQNVCQSYSAADTATLIMTGNTIRRCKFGIRVDGDALVVATGNTIAEPWVSAFDVRGAGRLRAEGNRLKTRSGGFTDVSDVQRALVVARNDGRARVDLGGGDGAARSVVDGTFCASGGDCSAGGNRLCSTGSGAQADIWNLTDCPCLEQFCSGGLGVCTAHSCAPVDPAGACAGTGGSGASVGARNNCFAAAEGPLATVHGTVDTTGATACAQVDCDF